MDTTTSDQKQCNPNRDYTTYPSPGDGQREEDAVSHATLSQIQIVHPSSGVNTPSNEIDEKAETFKGAVTPQAERDDPDHTLTVSSEEEPPKAIEDDRNAGFNSQTNYVPTSMIITIFLSLSIITFAIVLDQTTLSVAAPIIGTDLNAGDRTSFITASYFLTSTSFQFIYGRISDFFGRKPLLMVLLVIFFIGSLGSSLSPEVISLVVFRAVTGIAGGGLLTVGQFVIADVVSLRDRGKYQGILGSVIVIGNGLGPLVGGALAQKASWRDIYRMMLPLIAFGAAIAWRFLPLKRVEGDWKKKAAAVDWYGSGLSFIAVTLVVVSILERRSTEASTTHSYIQFLTYPRCLLFSIPSWVSRGLVAHTPGRIHTYWLPSSSASSLQVCSFSGNGKAARNPDLP